MYCLPTGDECDHVYCPPAGDDVYFLMGGDFTHSDAHMWFSNMDKLIHYVNRDGRINTFYSTPSRYVHAKRSTPGIRFALKTDDFLPHDSQLVADYEEGGHQFWTGFYTSRPTLKAQIRQGWSLLQAARQVEVLAELEPSGRHLAASKGLRYDGPQAVSVTADFGRKVCMVSVHHAITSIGPDAKPHCLQCMQCDCRLL